PWPRALSSYPGPAGFDDKAPLDSTSTTRPPLLPGACVHAASRIARKRSADCPPSIDKLWFRTRRRRVGSTGLARIIGKNQLDLALGIQPDLDMPSVYQASEQQLVRQGASDGVLDKPLHRPRAHGWI